MSIFLLQREETFLYEAGRGLQTILRRLQRRAKLTFHWRGGYLTREALKELLDLIRKAGEEKKKTPVVNVNLLQAVLEPALHRGTGTECITMDDANEGKRNEY